MSLIHQALKKAEEHGSAAVPPVKSSYLFGIDKKKESSTRTIVLGALMVVALIFAVWVNFFYGKTPSSVSATATTPQAAQTGAQSASIEAVRLKTTAEEAYRAGDMDRAWATLSAAQQIAPSDQEVLNNMGLVAKEKGTVAEARGYFEKALVLKPDYPEALNNLAVLDMDAGNDVMAKDKLVRALTLRPDYPEANLNLAMILEREGANAEAVKHYLTFLRNAQDEKPLFLEDVRKHVIEIEE